jgi:hypothetical protein
MYGNGQLDKARSDIVLLLIWTKVSFGKGKTAEMEISVRNVSIH